MRISIFDGYIDSDDILDWHIVKDPNFELYSLQVDLRPCRCTIDRYGSLSSAQLNLQSIKEYIAKKKLEEL